MNIYIELQKAISEAMVILFNHKISHEKIDIQPTRKEFSGIYTFITFPFRQISKRSLEETGKAIGKYLTTHTKIVTGYNVVKGFLNLEIASNIWVEMLNTLFADKDFGKQPSNGKQVMVEYSSPNTNKPLHLGHLRNNFLGYSISNIYRILGYDVIRVQIINDRGIHICKSMIAWQKFGNNETPESTGLKGDKLVGKYYVAFDKYYKQEIARLIKAGKSKEEAEKQAPILLEAQEMLRKWEAKDSDIYKLWQTMNNWVYNGFDITYKQMGVHFDKLYYESNTYLLGKKTVKDGLSKKIFYKKEDESVWVDLTADGLDEKIVLRSDGTSVYMTQDIGTATERFKEYSALKKLIYIVGNEQDYHFKVLFLILKKLGYDWADECYHLSYGLVNLLSGKMKSREGTVVDADDIMAKMINTAKVHTEKLGKVDDFNPDQAKKLYETLGMGAIKYFLLKVDPKKDMLFNPKESIQFQGNTGPFIQYTHARISAILRRAKKLNINYSQNISDEISLNQTETHLIYLISEYPNKITQSAEEYSPAIIAQYAFSLAKEYNKFYTEFSIFKEKNTGLMQLRIKLSAQIAQVIKSAMNLMGMTVPERM